MNEGHTLQFRLRTLFVAIALLAFLADGVMYVVNLPYVSSNRVDGVHQGMAEAEVIAIMGPPHDKYESGDGYFWSWNRWFGGVAIVHFSRDGEVVDALDVD
jgi:hypothetical protein